MSNDEKDGRREDGSIMFLCIRIDTATASTSSLLFLPFGVSEG